MPDTRLEPDYIEASELAVEYNQELPPDGPVELDSFANRVNMDENVLREEETTTVPDFSRYAMMMRARRILESNTESSSDDDIRPNSDIRMMNAPLRRIETTLRRPEPEIEYDESYTFIHVFFLSAFFTLAAIMISNSCYANRNIFEKKLTYTVYSQHHNVDNEEGILKHVHLVLKRVGYEHGTNTSDWDLLWSHDYPFRSLRPTMTSLKPNQLVNHFPGTGYITNKVDFATSGSKYIPKAFKLPQDKIKFKKYVDSEPDTMFVVKDNQHRGVYLKNVSDINVDAEGNFVQEYVKNPFLVDGHKFDIGVYTILTSVNPLRVYTYKGDVLFRYCPVKYHPFDPSILDKYVIGDDYMPTWEIPSLAPLYSTMGYSMKESFDHYVRSQGKDPSIVWKQVDEFLAEIFLKNERLIVSALKNYKKQNNFFQMMRFDFLIDGDLNVYALEANMSPNLSSAHFPANQLLYEQVLYSMFSLVGVAKYTKSPTLADRTIEEVNMKVSTKNIAVWSNACGSDECLDNCNNICSTCRHCLSPESRKHFSRAVIEHFNRNDCRRVYPPPMVQGKKIDFVGLQELTPSNKLMYLWYQGKCNQDITWCT